MKPQPIDERSDVNVRIFREEIATSAQPVILRGIAADWPAVRAADPAAYLLEQASAAPFDILLGAPKSGGRIFYNSDMSGLNFERTRADIATIVDRLRAAAPDTAPPAIAAQSVPADEAVPAFARENVLPILPAKVRPRLWIGNRILVATHQDMYANIAVVVAGRRIFTLFPPDQVANLYIGPFEFTPNGTPVSLVDLDRPDLQRFPRFADALANARSADLGPGDAIYIPYMWWHHVRSRDAFNLLANYWWNDADPAQPGLAPIDAMVHALLCFSGLPPEQRAAWAGMFEALVFDPNGAAYIPEKLRGVRGMLSEETKARIRRQLGGLMAH